MAITKEIQSHYSSGRKTIPAVFGQLENTESVATESSHERGVGQSSPQRKDDDGFKDVSEKLPVINLASLLDGFPDGTIETVLTNLTWILLYS